MNRGGLSIRLAAANAILSSRAVIETQTRLAEGKKATKVIEIERKFLVTGDGWRAAVKSTSLLRQGYLSPVGSPATIRARCLPGKAFLAIKGPRIGLARPEFEYEIPVADAEEMLSTLCEKRMLEKARYVVEADSLTWNVDEFRGANSGLVLAEVELSRADQPLSLPAWVGEDVPSSGAVEESGQPGWHGHSPSEE